MVQNNRKLWRDDLDIDQDPLKVLIIRDKLIDPKRENRTVKVKIYYPTEHSMTNLPIIFWSHGLGGGADGAAFLSRFLAAQGFVLIHMQHEGTDTSLWEGKDGHPWDIIRKTHIPRETTLNRFYDVPFLLDELETLLDKHPEVKNMADTRTLGMSGHSFGALTTQVIAGMKFPAKDGTLLSFKDSRIQCGILYSPGSVEHLDDPDPTEVYPSIDIPLFHMTGTDDGSPISDRDYTMRLAVYEHTRKAEKHLLVKKDGDHMIYNGSRGKLGQNPNREKHEAIIKVAALAFWEAQLKSDKSAQNWLASGAFSDYLANEATYKMEDAPA